MKKLLVFAALAALCTSLVACAPASSGEKVKVKCPACGYEFEAPASRP